MKQSDEILQHAGETVEYARQYVQQQVDYYRLELAERMSKTIASAITMIIIMLFIVMIIIFLSIAVALYLGKLWESYEWAFVGVAGFHLLLGFIIYALRRHIITNPLLSEILKSFLD